MTPLKKSYAGNSKVKRNYCVIFGWGLGGFYSENFKVGVNFLKFFIEEVIRPINSSIIRAVGLEPFELKKN